VLQQRVIPCCTTPSNLRGFLWLGGSETIGNHPASSRSEDAKHKIYARSRAHSGLGTLSCRPAAPRVPLLGPWGRGPARAPNCRARPIELLSSRFAPPGVLVSADLEILQFRGQTERLPCARAGKASLNLLKMLREGLLVGVRAAVLRAGAEGIPVREEGLGPAERGIREVAVEVIPFGVTRQGRRLPRPVRGRAHGPEAASLRPPGPPEETLRVPDSEATTRLAQELSATREYLRR
jgi:two-component system CheB/CheR fusion protein